LIDSLGLKLHPEGGYYREVYSSPISVDTGDGRKEISALTTIYFLLPGGECSRFHRLKSDEVWHYYEGDELELFLVDREDYVLRRRLVGPVVPDRKPVTVIPAGSWQAARCTGNYVLAGCSVGPGFRFEDFEMLSDNPDEKKKVIEACPEIDCFV